MQRCHEVRSRHEKEEGGGKGFDASDRDPLFNDAAKLIVQNQVGSTSLNGCSDTLILLDFSLSASFTNTSPRIE